MQTGVGRTADFPVGRGAGPTSAGFPNWQGWGVPPTFQSAEGWGAPQGFQPAGVGRTANFPVGRGVGPTGAGVCQAFLAGYLIMLGHSALEQFPPNNHLLTSMSSPVRRSHYCRCTRTGAKAIALLRDACQGSPLTGQVLAPLRHPSSAKSPNRPAPACSPRPAPSRYSEDGWGLAQSSAANDGYAL